MEMFLIVLVLLLLIGISNMVNHFIPFIPVPLIQIALGALLALLPLGFHVPMETELFLVLFIAPLLFHDGKNVPRSALWELRKPILLLALGLVFVTVFVIGYLIHWLIPSIPLPAAFALAAILSPTDVVAVSAISSRSKLPSGIKHLLEGEGLMNDASGLVAFKFAVAATVTGVFSLGQATISFVLIALGGMIAGVILSYIIIRLRMLIRRWGMEDVTIHMLIQLLTPFIIFLIAEHFGVSGILAVVAAGIVHAIERDREESPTMKLKIVSTSTWSVILYILNGLVFVLLGLQLPSVSKTIFSNPEFNNSQVIWYIVIITGALLALRYIWLNLWWWLGGKMRKMELFKLKQRTALITTVSGVRGAVTLAGAFSIPYVLNDGSPFPERSLFIFIAAGVILLTLIVASICLPILSKSEEPSIKEDKDELERKAIIHVKEAAIQSIEAELNEENRAASLAVITKYTQLIERLKLPERPEDTANNQYMEEKIRFKALVAEKRCINELIKEEKVDRETAYIGQQFIHRMEVAVTNKMKYRLMTSVVFMKRTSFKMLKSISPGNEKRVKLSIQTVVAVRNLKIQTAKAAIAAIKADMTPINRGPSLLVIREYRRLISKLNRENMLKSSNDKLLKLEKELHYKAFQAERDEVQAMYEQGKLTRELAQKIRQQINLREAFLIEEKTYQS